ncbi:hypothetical protein [Microcoleus sp. herbarium14]|uniref:hypothetical protein n=1 Tax=Microcoleus sp. herbarium14 TaxID=3055439 RepID=UPI002FD1CA22
MHQSEPRPYDAVLDGSGQPTPCYEYLLPSDFDAERLSQLVLAKRGKRGYRDTAKEIGIRIAIYQAENAYIKNQAWVTEIHFEDFLALCKWLSISAAELVLTLTLQKILAARGGSEPGPYDAVMGGYQRHKT